MAYASKQKEKEYALHYRETHKRRQQDYGVARRKDNREKNQNRKKLVISHYSNGANECACCGEKEIHFLTIDHINGGGTKHFKEIGMGTSFYRWLINNKFPPGFQVLCFNCNCAKGHFGICPHERKRKELNDQAIIRIDNQFIEGEPKCEE